MHVVLIVCYLVSFYIVSNCDKNFDKEARKINTKIRFKISGFRNQQSKGVNKGCCGIKENQKCLPCNFRFDLYSEGFGESSNSKAVTKKTVLGTSSQPSEELFESYEISFIFNPIIYEKHSIEVSSMQYTSAVQDSFRIIDSITLSKYIYQGTFGENNFIELWAELYLERISLTKDYFTAFLRIDSIYWINFKTKSNECCHLNQDEECKSHCNYQIRWNLEDDYLSQSEISPINDERKVNVSTTLISANSKLKTAKLSYIIELYSQEKQQLIDTYTIKIVKDMPNIEYKAYNARGAFNNVILNMSWMHNCPISKGLNCNKKCNSDGIISSCDPVTGQLFCLNGAKDHPKCEIFPNDCTINPCKNKGKCLMDNGTLICKCKRGYLGKLCQNWRCDKGCENNGKCVGPNICNCLPPFIGKRCQEFHCNEEKDKKCGEFGDCLIVNGLKVCICRNPFLSGENCSEPICDADCIFGFCKFLPNVKVSRCICKELYEGSSCNILKKSLGQNDFNPRYAGTIIGISMFLFILCIIYGLMFFKFNPSFYSNMDIKGHENVTQT